MRFDEAVQYLLSLGNEVSAMKLGLRNSELLFHALGSPHKSFPSVQIAGTNGKGSVTAILDSICRHAGIKTGSYTSPHLTSITERIKISGVDVSEELFGKHATRVRNAAERLVSSKILEAPPTFFEQVTAIGLSIFQESKVDLAILETGLGGRLDSTTAAGAQLVAITSIALDHQQYLGETLAQIAAEKAAIIRPGVEAVIGPQPEEALSVVLARCQAVGVVPADPNWDANTESVSKDGLFTVTYETDVDTYPNVTVGLRGKHQVENTAIAIQLAERLRTFGFSVPQKAIVRGIESAVHPGRLELISGVTPVLFDGAHNAAGARALRDYLKQFGTKPLSIVFGAMADKRLGEILEILFPIADRVVLTPVNNSRSASTNTLQSIAETILPEERIDSASSSRKAIEIAMQESGTGLVCVTGSLYLIGELRPVLLQNTAPAVV